MKTGTRENRNLARNDDMRAFGNAAVEFFMFKILLDGPQKGSNKILHNNFRICYLMNYIIFLDISYIFSVVTIQHVQSQLYIAMNSDGRLITTVSS